MIDHIVLAVADLAAGVAGFHRLTGVRPMVGGSHVGRGTANHLVGLGRSAYLEIIGPDPDQPEPAQPRPFGIDALAGSRVVTWAIHPPDFDGCIAAALAGGYDPGPPSAMSRRTPDGTLLTWRLTPAADDPTEGVVPFLIDWGQTRHPTAAAALPILPLRYFQLEHPDPARIRRALAALDLDVPVRSSVAPRLVVTLQAPHAPIVVS